MASALTSDGTGFNFDNVQRNALLTQRGIQPPSVHTTGTTLAGLVFKVVSIQPGSISMGDGQDGVVLGSDTRATAGSVVADKNTQKLNRLADNVYCAGSGTAADIAHVAYMVSSALTLHALDTGRQIRTITAETILKNHLRRHDAGYVSAGLILGGVDFSGAHLSTIYPHGSTDALPYATMGSGSLNAMSVLESDFKENLNKQEAMQLVTRAIRGGIFNDLASGSNVDLVIITKDGAEMIRGHQFLMAKTYQRTKPPTFPHGPSKVLKEQIISLKELVIDDADAMDTS